MARASHRRPVTSTVELEITHRRRVRVLRHGRDLSGDHRRLARDPEDRQELLCQVAEQLRAVCDPVCRGLTDPIDLWYAACFGAVRHGIVRGELAAGPVPDDLVEVLAEPGWRQAVEQVARCQLPRHEVRELAVLVSDHGSWVPLRLVSLLLAAQDSADRRLRTLTDLVMPRTHVWDGHGWRLGHTRELVAFVRGLRSGQETPRTVRLARDLLASGRHARWVVDDLAGCTVSDKLLGRLELGRYRDPHVGQLLAVTGRCWANANAARAVQRHLAAYDGHTPRAGAARLLVPADVNEVVRWGRQHRTCVATRYPRRVADDVTTLVGIDLTSRGGRRPDLVVELNLEQPVGLLGEVVNMLGPDNRWPTVDQEMAAWECLASCGLLDDWAVARIPPRNVAHLLARVVAERDAVQVSEDAAAAAGAILWLAGHQRQLDVADETTLNGLAFSGPVTPRRRPRTRAETLAAVDQLPLRHRTARRLLHRFAVPLPAPDAGQQLALLEHPDVAEAGRAAPSAAGAGRRSKQPG